MPEDSCADPWIAIGAVADISMSTLRQPMHASVGPSPVGASEAPQDLGGAGRPPACVGRPEVLGIPLLLPMGSDGLSFRFLL